MITPLEIELLARPFAPEEYEARYGYRKDGKVRYFIYIRRKAIQDRLDRMFPGEWEVRQPHGSKKYSGYTDVYVEIVIRGQVRGMNGAQSSLDKEGNPIINEQEGKGAFTDAFKRAASMWGMGLDLQDSPAIFASDGQSALEQFYEWHSKYTGMNTWSWIRIANAILERFKFTKEQITSMKEESLDTWNWCKKIYGEKIGTYQFAERMDDLRKDEA